MKKSLLVFAGAIAISFSACISKDKTADEGNTIDDGMRTSENTLGTGSTRPSDKQGYTGQEAGVPTADVDPRTGHPDAVQKNAQGQTIHQGGIPGSADTSRTGTAAGQNTGQTTGNQTRTNQNTGTTQGTQTR